jgi:hypothetical protein
MATIHNEYTYINETETRVDTDEFLFEEPDLYLESEIKYKRETKNIEKAAFTGNKRPKMLQQTKTFTREEKFSNSRSRLPGSYVEAEEKNKFCGNCHYVKWNNYCNLWKSPVQSRYYCNKWKGHRR